MGGRALQPLQECISYEYLLFSAIGASPTYQSTQPQNSTSDSQKWAPSSTLKLCLSPWRLATQHPGAFSVEVGLTMGAGVCPGPRPHPQWLWNALLQSAAPKSHATGHSGTWCLGGSHLSWPSPWNKSEEEEAEGQALIQSLLSWSPALGQS